MPKSVRQALGLEPGDRVIWQVAEDREMVSKAPPDAAHADPAIRAFLAFLERDIGAGDLVADLPPEVMESLDELRALDVDPEAGIDGETVL